MFPLEHVANILQENATKRAIIRQLNHQRFQTDVVVEPVDRPEVVVLRNVGEGLVESSTKALARGGHRNGKKRFSMQRPFHSAGKSDVFQRVNSDTKCCQD